MGKDMPSHDDLDAALASDEIPEVIVDPEIPTDNPTDTTPADDQPVETPPEEPPAEIDEHKEKSGLGRKVKRLESQIETLLARIGQLQEQPAIKPVETAEEEDDYVKASDVPKIVQRERQREQEERTKYETDYLHTAIKMGSDEQLPDEVQDAVFDEMEKSFNRRRTGDPVVDAELNYRAALASVYSKKITTPRNPLKGGKPDAALGVGASTSNAPKDAPKKVKLDPQAAEFAKQMGMTDEDIAAALDRKSPALRMNSRMM